MNIKSIGLIAGLALVGIAPASADIVTFNLSGVVFSASGPGAPSLGDASQATITFDTAALGTPYLPGIVDYNSAVISFSADSSVLTPTVSNIRVFDNFQQGSLYYDGVQFDVGTGERNFHINLFTQTTSPSQITTSTDLPIAPFDLNSLVFRDYSYTLFNGLFSPQTNVGIDIRSVTLASSVPEVSTWAMMVLGFAGIGAMTFRQRKKLTPRVA
jgi:hypothetical protein